MINDINWDAIESDFAAGWKWWIALGGLDSSTCLDHCGVRRSFEFRDGYEAAALYNKQGHRPTAQDAWDHARFYVEEKRGVVLFDLKMHST